MKNVIEAINELIKGVNVAQSRGVYTLSEAHDIFEAIKYINNTIASSQQQQGTQVNTNQESEK